MIQKISIGVLWKRTICLLSCWHICWTQRECLVAMAPQCSSFDLQPNRDPSSWITLASRSLRIGSIIYIVYTTNFLICFQYAKALPFERWPFCYCPSPPPSSKANIMWTPYSRWPAALLSLWGINYAVAAGYTQSLRGPDPPVRRELLFWSLSWRQGGARGLECADSW